MIHLGFKFPSLDSQTEKLLWRRKVDLELSLRQLESLSGDNFMFVIFLILVLIF